jgi:hypothetical protein
MASSLVAVNRQPRAYPPLGAPRTKGRGGSADGGASRVDVVDEQDVPRHTGARRREGTPDVPPPVLAVEGSLPSNGARPREERRRLEAPEARELPRQTLGRLVPAPEAPVAVGRDEGDDVGGGGGHDLGHDLRRYPRQGAETALLPGAHEPAGGAGVEHRAACGSERKPPP